MDSAIKYQVVEKIIQSNDDSLLNEIKLLVGLSENDFWTNCLEDVKQAVSNAKAELDRGEGIPHEDVMLEIKKRFQDK